MRPFWLSILARLDPWFCQLFFYICRTLDAFDYQNFRSDQRLRADLDMVCGCFWDLVFVSDAIHAKKRTYLEAA